MKKSNAFTMIELIIVLVVLGIIAVLSAPRLKRDTRAEAATQILHMIRYTQNLALHDSKHQRDTSRWQRAYWKFQVYTCRNNDKFFTIGTNSDLIRRDISDISVNEAAIDPSNSKPLTWHAGKPCPTNDSSLKASKVSPNIFITQKYGINKVEFSSCKVFKTKAVSSNSVKHIGFDGFGRVYRSFTATSKANHWGYAVEDCKITFSFADSSIYPFTIVVENETGYTYLEEKPNL